MSKAKSISEIDAGPKSAIGGVKFLLFVQPPYSAPGWETPEVVTIKKRTEIKQGPEDNRFKVVDAKDKQPYDGTDFPPWRGQTYPGAKPDAQGNFDYHKPGTREFNDCTMYATVRRVLDIWEEYLGKDIQWYNQGTPMELIPQIEWNNAQSGLGFLEFGFARGSDGSLDHSKPYCQNFDVLAHEMGHNLVFSLVKFPKRGRETDFFGGFHESAGDLVAILSALHFNQMVDKLLENTKGNLFSRNELSRLGEVSYSSEIRLAFNDVVMPRPSEPHQLSVPLTGAIFDILVEVFQIFLVQYDAISQDLANRSYNSNQPLSSSQEEQIQQEFSAAYDRNKVLFKKALVKARNYVGRLLALTWENLNPNDLTYEDVAIELINTDAKLTGGRYFKTIHDCFVWRNIDVNLSNSFFTRIHKAFEQPMRYPSSIRGKVPTPFTAQSTTKKEGIKKDTGKIPTAPQKIVSK